MYNELSLKGSTLRACHNCGGQQTPLVCWHFDVSLFQEPRRYSAHELHGCWSSCI